MKRYVLLLFVFTSVVMVACGNKSANRGKSVNNIVEEARMDSVTVAGQIQADVYETSQGELKVTLLGHASLMFEYAGKTIHVDPYSNVADYSKLPKADLIMLTHEHGDHLDVSAINAIKKADTHFIVSKICNERLGYGDIMSNGNKSEWNGIPIDAVPAYNIVNKNPEGSHYHPKGRGNGYVFTFGDKRVYVAGDTENIPEMDRLTNTVDIAFLPKNLPYTMNDDMFIDAAKKVNPKILYPYHMSEFNNEKISTALETTNINLVVRPMSNK